MQTRLTLLTFAFLCAATTVVQAAVLPPSFKPLLARAEALYAQAAQLDAKSSKTEADVTAHKARADAYAKAIDVFEDAVDKLPTDFDLEAQPMVTRTRLAQFGRYAANSVDSSLGRCSPNAARGNLRVSRAFLDDARAHAAGKGQKADWTPPVLKAFVSSSLSGTDEHCPDD